MIMNRGWNNEKQETRRTRRRNEMAVESAFLWSDGSEDIDITRRDGSGLVCRSVYQLPTAASLLLCCRMESNRIFRWRRILRFARVAVNGAVASVPWGADGGPCGSTCLSFFCFFSVVCCVFPQTGDTTYGQTEQTTEGRPDEVLWRSTSDSDLPSTSNPANGGINSMLSNTPRSSLGNDSTAAKHQFYLALQTIQKKQSSIGKISNHTKTYSLRIHHPSAMTSNSHPDDPHRHIHASGKRSSDSSARYN